MENTTRTIHTGLYSSIAKEILDSVIGQLSDGMWENSTSMEKYWKFAAIDRADDNEIVIKVSKSEGKSDGSYRHYRYTSNGFSLMDDMAVGEWFAKKVKHIAVAELKDNEVAGGWKRDNTLNTSCYLSYHEKITIKDIYYVYEHLLGRNPAKHAVYGDMTHVIGTKLSAAEAKVRRQKTADATAENNAYADQVAKLEAEKKAAIEKIEAEYEARRSREWEAHRSRLAAINAA